jgi:hypothetical protein
LAVVAIAGGVLFAFTREDSVPLRARVDDRMVPLVSTHDATVTMPISLPNGRRVVVSYPGAVDVAGLGVRFQTTLDWPVSVAGTGGLRCCHREINLSYGTVADLYPNAIAAAVYPGSNGSKVFLFRASQRRVPPVPYADADQLVFQFGRWVAEVWTSVPGAEDRIEPLTVQQQAVWATNLRAETRNDGFVVLHPQPPLQEGAANVVFVYFGDDPVRGGTGTGLLL